ncbi:MAG: porin [Verrucomicrobiota bacterium]|nr:porin [Verrucomicrobiota bacterium]
MQTSTRLGTKAWGAVLLTSIATLTPLRAETEVELLRKSIAELEQRLKVIERKQELDKESADAAAKTQPVVKVDSSGFGVESKDKAWGLKIRGNIQLDGRFYLDDGGVNNNDRFLFRRIRPSLEGTVGKSFTFRIMPDFAPATFELLDAYGNYKFSDGFNLLFGRTKSPAGLERLISQTNLPFIERGYPTSILPNRDTGIQLHGKLFNGTLNWNLSALNGTTDGQSSPATQLDDDIEFAGRLFANPFINEDGSVLQRLGAGVSVTYGNQENTAPAGYRTTGQQTSFSWLSDVKVDGEVFRVSPQAYYYYGPFGFLAEYAVSQQRLVNPTAKAQDSLVNTAWQAYASWVLTGEDASYEGVKPAEPFSIADGKWGAFEVVARVGQLEIDKDAFALDAAKKPTLFADPAKSARSVTGATLGLNWYLTRNAKFVVNYDWNQFDGGAAGGKDKIDEKAIFTRLQLNF